MKVNEIARMVSGELVLGSKDPDVEITSLGSLHAVQADGISFLTDPRLSELARATRGAAVITADRLEGCAAHQIVHPDPYAAMAELSLQLYPQKHSFQGISPDADISDDAVIAEDVTIYPRAFIDRRVVLGPGTVIYPGVFVGADTTVGAQSLLYANVTVMPRCQIGDRVIIHSGAVIGADGFGFAPTAHDIKKIPQVGRVVVGDDVEIGANSTVDRATFDETVIGRGCKIDAQVHVGHNVQVGEWTMLCGQVGIAGSAKIGSRCIAAGRAGISQGVQVGDRVVMGAASVVLQDLSEPGEYQGFPAQPSMAWRREVAASRRLATMAKRIAALERRLSGEQQE